MCACADRAPRMTRAPLPPPCCLKRGAGVAGLVAGGWWVGLVGGMGLWLVRMLLAEARTRVCADRAPWMTRAAASATCCLKRRRGVAGLVAGGWGAVRLVGGMGLALGARPRAERELRSVVLRGLEWLEAVPVNRVILLGSENISNNLYPVRKISGLINRLVAC